MRTTRPRTSVVRRLLTLALAGTTLLAVAGCGNDPTADDATGTPSATATDDPGKDKDKDKDKDKGDDTASPDPSGEATSAPTTPAGPRVKDAKVTVAAGEVKVKPKVLSVRPGHVVKIAVTSDVADELRVGGVDQTLAVAAGEPATLEFTVAADAPLGEFPVELGTSGQLLFVLEVKPPSTTE